MYNRCLSVCGCVCVCALCIMCGFCATFSTLCLFGLLKVPWKCCKKKIEKSDVELNNVSVRLSWRWKQERKKKTCCGCSWSRCRSCTRSRIRSHRALWHVCNVTRRFMHSPESCTIRIDSATQGFVWHTFKMCNSRQLLQLALPYLS